MLKKSYPICKFYRTKQGCRFKDCKFRHTDSAESTLVNTSYSTQVTSPATPITSTSTEINQELNHCVKNTHDEAVNSSDVTEERVGGSQQHNKAATSEESCQESAAVVLSSDTNSSITKQKQQPKQQHAKSKYSEKEQICIFFAQRGWCAYNKRCKFAHLRGDRHIYPENVRVVRSNYSRAKEWGYGGGSKIATKSRADFSRNKSSDNSLPVQVENPISFNHDGSEERVVVFDGGQNGSQKEISGVSLGDVEQVITNDPKDDRVVPTSVSDDLRKDSELSEATSTDPEYGYTQFVDVGDGPTGVHAAGGTSEDGTIKTSTTSVDVGDGPTGVHATEGTSKDGTIKPSTTFEYTRSVDVGDGPTGVHAAEGTSEDGTIKPSTTSEYTQSMDVGDGPTGVHAAEVIGKDGTIKPSTTSEYTQSMDVGDGSTGVHPAEGTGGDGTIKPSTTSEYTRSVDVGDGLTTVHAVEVISKDDTMRSSTTSDSVHQRVKCKYFMRGYCWYNQHCRFSHDIPRMKQTRFRIYPCTSEERKKIEDNPKVGVSEGTESTAVQKPRGNCEELIDEARAETMETVSNVNLTKKNILRTELTEEEIRKLRIIECNQLKKRISSEKLRILEESPYSTSYQFEFTPTDPDWPFDIVTFPLLITIPALYPLEVFSITLVEDGRIPDTVRSHIDASMAEWLTAKQNQLVTDNRVELLFRPFLHWLDRSLEEIVTEGLRQFKKELEAKAAGFEFIIPKTTDVKERVLNVYDENRGDQMPSSTGMISNSDESDDTEDDAHIGQDEELNKEDGLCERRGTEIVFRNLQFLDGVATLLVEKLSIIIQCDRCKNKIPLSTPSGRLNEVTCEKCNTTQRLVYRSMLCHQFSSVIGYLDVESCGAFDVTLPECSVTIACEKCSSDMKGQTMLTGQVKEAWCRSCHGKMKLAVDTVRLTVLTQSSVISNQKIHKISVTKLQKNVKDPAIQEGKRLPDNGTCKHYKKSYRWFRFPCCGKCYPCDLCHEETEAGDHEMKRANRMICGHCCHEQPFSNERPCAHCGSNLTKSRSSYWEGGRGCRDKITMNRGDTHKYKNSKKTISNKAQSILDKNKKTTKLRHV